MEKKYICLYNTYIYIYVSQKIKNRFADFAEALKRFKSSTTNQLPNVLMCVVFASKYNNAAGNGHGTHLL